MGIWAEYHIARKGALRIQANPVCQPVRRLVSLLCNTVLIHHRDSESGSVPINPVLQEKIPCLFVHAASTLPDNRVFPGHSPIRMPRATRESTSMLGYAAAPISTLLTAMAMSVNTACKPTEFSFVAVPRYRGAD